MRVRHYLQRISDVQEMAENKTVRNIYSTVRNFKVDLKFLASFMLGLWSEL